jgi:pSer/pThr/pTyr-binding forkhead associated (FHA) protein/Mg-chelatase subunit ChlD
MRKYSILLILVVLHSVLYTSDVQGEVASSRDIVMVLDNSGSMKKNDPGFLTKNVVSDFLDRLSGDVRISLIIFDEKSRLAIPLTPSANEETSQKIIQTLDELNYRGMYTNIPSAIERAIYELKENGRKDVEKLIIFMTDGIIDTGNQAQDMEKYQWLKDELSLESKEAGIRIFGIAFTEHADFELIQALGLKTGGGYYRAFKVEDIQGVLSRINESISKPEPEPEARPAVVVTTEQQRDFPMRLVGLSAIGLLAIVIVSVVMRARRAGALQGSVPEACLIDVDGITDRENYRIDKSVVTVGRKEHDSIDISLNIDTVSAAHAQIEYRDHGFYLTDLHSTNGSYLNGCREANRITDPVRLRSGDIVFFGSNKFRFVSNDQDKLDRAKLNQMNGGTMLIIPDAPPLEPKGSEQMISLPSDSCDEMAQEVKPEEAESMWQESESEEADSIWQESESDESDSMWQESKSEPLDDMEKERIEKILRSAGGNKTEASKMLGISRQTLYNKMKKLDIPLEEDYRGHRL